MGDRDVLLSMENVLAEIGRMVGVEAGDVPGLLERISELTGREHYRTRAAACRDGRNPDLFGRYAWGVTKAGATLIYYELIDEWRPERRPGPAGGTLTLQVRTGRQAWRACVLYADPAQPVEVAGEVLAAIETDQLHMKSKEGGRHVD